MLHRAAEGAQEAHRAIAKDAEDARIATEDWATERVDEMQAALSAALEGQQASEMRIAQLEQEIVVETRDHTADVEAMVLAQMGSAQAAALTCRELEDQAAETQARWQKILSDATEKHHQEIKELQDELEMVQELREEEILLRVQGQQNEAVLEAEQAELGAEQAELQEALNEAKEAHSNDVSVLTAAQLASSEAGAIALAKAQEALADTEKQLEATGGELQATTKELEAVQKQRAETAWKLADREWQHEVDAMRLEEAETKHTEDKSRLTSLETQLKAATGRLDVAERQLDIEVKKCKELDSHHSSEMMQLSETLHNTQRQCEVELMQAAEAQSRQADDLIVLQAHHERDVVNLEEVERRFKAQRMQLAEAKAWREADKAKLANMEVLEQALQETTAKLRAAEQELEDLVAAHAVDAMQLEEALAMRHQAEGIAVLKAQAAARAERELVEIAKMADAMNLNSDGNLDYADDVYTSPNDPKSPDPEETFLKMLTGTGNDMASHGEKQKGETSQNPLGKGEHVVNNMKPAEDWSLDLKSNALQGHGTVLSSSELQVKLSYMDELYNAL